MSPGERLDAIVVGGGPAGISAATWLGRYRRRVLLVDAGEQRNRWVDEVHGYLGSDPIGPSKLLARSRAELAQYPSGLTLDGRVLSVEGESDGFVVRTDEAVHESRRVVLATGVIDEFPQIDGFLEHYGTSVFHCSTCDGYQARDRRVVVLGWQRHVAGFARGLLNWAAAVTIVTEGRRFEGDSDERRALGATGIDLIEDDGVELVGPRGSLEAVRLRAGGEVPCDMAFFSIAHHPRTELAVSLGCALDEDGVVVVDEQGMSAVDGVYAAGDVTPGLQLLQVAAAGGAVAGVHCAQSLDPGGKP